MPKMNLTQLAAERLRSPQETAITYFDTNLPGFGLRVSPKGRKTFVAQYRVKGGPEVLETLGTMAVLPSVADARDLARQSMMLARRGIHPVKQRRQQEAEQQAEQQARAFTFEMLVRRYMDEYADRNTKPSSAREVGRLLGLAAGFFADRPVHEIKKADILELISRRPARRKAINTGLTEATNLLAVVRRAFRWAVSQDLVTADPTFGVLKPLARPHSRDRFLSDDEIVAFWQGCDKIGWPFGPLFKLLLLTGQRLHEVGGMRWSELDLDNRVWHLPPAIARNKASRTKNGKAHDVHLSDQALEIIDGLYRFKPEPGRPDFVFSFRGHGPVNGYPHAKTRVAEIMGVEDWRLHDLRRTATTGMARLGIPPHVADRVLNHTSGTISGVAAVYNRFQYHNERRDALEKWGSFVERLVNGNVVTLLAG